MRNLFFLNVIAFVVQVSSTCHGWGRNPVVMFLARIFTQHLKRNRWQMPTIKVESCVPTFEQEAIFLNLWKHEQNQYTHYTYIITESYISSSVHGSFWHGKWFISFVLKQTILSTGFNSWILNTHQQDVCSKLRLCWTSPNFLERQIFPKIVHKAWCSNLDFVWIL